mgnify:CR=1 FL=1
MRAISVTSRENISNFVLNRVVNEIANELGGDYIDQIFEQSVAVNSVYPQTNIIKDEKIYHELIRDFKSIRNNDLKAQVANLLYKKLVQQGS